MTTEEPAELTKLSEQQLAYAIETFKEAMTNLRHCQNMSFKVATWGAASLAAFSAWLLGQHDFQTPGKRVLLSLVALGFTTGLLVLQHNLRRQSRNALGIVARLDKTFGCFESDAYISHETLFPPQWSSIKKRHFAKRMFMPVSIPLFTALLVAIAVIYSR